MPKYNSTRNSKKLKHFIVHTRGSAPCPKACCDLIRGLFAIARASFLKLIEFSECIEIN